MQIHPPIQPRFKPEPRVHPRRRRKGLSTGTVGAAPGTVTASAVSPLTWSDEHLFTDGDTFFNAFCDGIESAQKTIELETYIFDLDSLGKRVLYHLARAAKRGVQVRVLLDGAGASQWTDHDARRCAKKGIMVRFFHPMPWQRHNFKIWQFLTLRRIALGMYKFNHRNHRKCLVIDGKAAFVGSMNVSARHLKSVKEEKAWRDTSVRVEGRSIAHLVEAFDTAWKFSSDYFCTLRRKMKLLSPINWVRLNHSETQARFYRHHLIHSLNTAQCRIWITNPYFVPDRRLLLALIAAAKRGVDVRLLFQHETDFQPGKYAGQSFYDPLLKAGVKIHEFLPSILHAKVLIIDDVGIVGSSNLNHRSIYHDLEADVILSNPANLAELAVQFERDLSHSQTILREQWSRRPWWIKFLERLFLLFRGIL